MSVFQKTGIVFVFGLALAAISAPAAHAQAAAVATDAAAAVTTIAASEAQAFLGSWVMDVQGTVLEFNIKDEAGKVAADVVVMGTTSKITTISKSGNDLTLAWNADMQGQQAPITIKLTPAGSDLAAAIDVAQGMFAATATATKKP